MEGPWKIRLTQAGMDVEAAVERLMGSEALLERFLKKFLEDSNYARLIAAVAAGDWESAVMAAHTLKGMCGNLSFTVLCDQFTRQVEYLRAGDTLAAKAMMPEISQAYERIQTAIQESVS